MFFGIQSSEGFELDTLNYSHNVFDHIKDYKTGKVLAAFVGNGPMLLNNMKDLAQAIIFNIMPGEMYGPGLMDVIFGRVNPSAKLSWTMPNIENEQ